MLIKPFAAFFISALTISCASTKSVDDKSPIIAPKVATRAPQIKEEPAPTLPPAAQAEEKAPPPKLLSPPRPRYPESAKAEGVDGKVSVLVSIDTSGHVVAVKHVVVNGDSDDERLISAAVAAAKSAVYSKAKLDESEERQAVLRIRFKLVE